MRTYRCYCDADWKPGEVLELTPAEGEHLVRIRRADAGDAVVLINGRGAEARARLVEIGKRLARIEVLENLRVEDSPPPALEIAPALTRTSAFDDMLQRTVELGATAIRPIAAGRGVVRLDEKKARERADRWRRLAVEALKQCERIWLPTIDEPASLEIVLRRAKEAGLEAVVLVERSPESVPLLDLLITSPRRPRCLFFGPEGGWTAEERTLASEGRLATFGKIILRAETAVLSALAVAQALGEG